MPGTAFMPQPAGFADIKSCFEETLMNDQLRYVRLRPRRAILTGTAAAIFAFVSTPAGAATNVVSCTPQAGFPTTVQVSPAAVNPPADAIYGLKFATVTGGCTANAAQLAT
jgi:hypothetical protein